MLSNATVWIVRARSGPTTSPASCAAAFSWCRWSASTRRAILMARASVHRRLPPCAKRLDPSRSSDARSAVHTQNRQVFAAERFQIAVERGVLAVQLPPDDVERLEFAEVH